MEVTNIMNLKTESIDSFESANGEETRVKDVKVEEAAEETVESEQDVEKAERTQPEVDMSQTIDGALEDRDGGSNGNVPTGIPNPVSEDGSKKRRQSELVKSIQTAEVEALVPNSTSIPEMNGANEQTVPMLDSLKLKSAGSVSLTCILSRNEEKKEEEKEDLDLSNPKDLLLYYLREVGYKADTKSSSSLANFFLELNNEHIEAYSVELVKAIRDRNIPLLRQFHESGRMLQCSNRFGESLLHMACRRGYTDVVRFLIKEADVSLRIKDDFGRTPLHDACWSASPNFELMELIIEHDPDLLLIEDGRGHSPFSYARRSHWKEWNDFLTARRETLRLNTFTD
jgi:hypothetical protein